MRKIAAILAFATLLIAAPAHAAISFVARAQNTVNAGGPTSLTLTVPASAATGDYMVAYVQSWAYAPAPPVGWVPIVSSTCNTNFDDGLYFRVITATDPGATYTWTNVGYAKIIGRDYRGVASGTPIDALSGVNAVCVASGTSVTIPALTRISNANEWYVGFFADNAASSAMTGPGDLSNTTADTTQWNSFDGDKTIAIAGTTPNAETATGPSGILQAFGLTLNPSFTAVAPQQWGPAAMPSTVCVAANCTNTTSSLATLQTNLTGASAGQQICFTGSGTLSSDLTFGASGTSGNPINLCCMAGSSITGSSVNGINLNGKSYVGVFGCTESGAGDSGIVSSGTNSHVTVEYNSVSGNGAGGISINNSDYDTIEYNSVHGNAGTNASDFSGISLYEPVAFDSLTGIHNRIAYNASYSNLNPSGGTDGNGIILDTFSNSAYTGKTVVDDNVNWLNNGACVKAYSAGTGAQNIFVNNSCYHNWQGNWSGTWRHELEYETSADNPIIANNLVVPDASILNNLTTLAAYDGGSGTPVIGNNIGNAVNLFFNAPTTDFRQLWESASRGAGLATVSSTAVYVPPLDSQGVPRPSKFDVGAYQYRGSVFTLP